ncbi:hypothetical protein R1flu_025389 [Riccia fluitans]|uniref:At3g05675-like ankyrin-like domain-containing protein n=1 Tax=Riccia fluitans TaxID=41844 RepID=A0ABD1XXM8_9MARC
MIRLSSSYRLVVEKKAENGKRSSNPPVCGDGDAGVINFSGRCDYRLIVHERGEWGSDLSIWRPAARFLGLQLFAVNYPINGLAELQKPHLECGYSLRMKTQEDHESHGNAAHDESINKKRRRVGDSGIFEVVDEIGAGSKQPSCVYNDQNTADILLNLTWTSPHQNWAAAVSTSEAGTVSETFSQQVHLHGQVLKKCRYFEALLSERWQELRLRDEEQESSDEPLLIKMTVVPSREVESYLTTLSLLYSYDFANVIVDIQSALKILPVASELLFDECIAACVAFLEAVPWSPEEEQQILQLVTDLQLEGASSLLARLGPPRENAVEEMLSGLIHSATHGNQKVPLVGVSVKTFVALMLSDHASRGTVKLVLEKAFATSLKTLKDSVEEYSNPNVRGVDDEIEALQRQNLYTAAVNARSLCWLIERMIELRVAKTAVEEWSKQDNLTANLRRALSEDLWRNVAPGLPGVVLRCTCRLACAVASGSIITSRQVRLKLVNDWLPVLIVSRDNQRLHMQNMQLHQELEDVFLKIISTLPMADSQKLLQQCLCFATRTVEDCSHLVSAFNTWFRRAGQDPLSALEKGSLEES